MKKSLYIFFSVLTSCLLLFSGGLFAQTAPVISYTGSPYTLTVGTAFNQSPSNTGGAVASLAFGAGVSLTGATLNNPYGIGIDLSGNIYVVNYGNNTVSKYNSSGTFLNSTFFTGGTINNPAGITFDAYGNAYLLNYNHTNQGLGNSNGNAYVDQYSSAGVFATNVISGLGAANGITIDASSNLYAAEGNNNGGNNTVSQFSTSGGLAFSTTTNTVNPVAVAVDGSGIIYALDNANLNVVKFNSSGTFISTFASGFTNPNAICIDGAGDIYVGDSGTGGTTGRVNVYSPAGTLLTSITGLTDPRGLVTDSKGNLYVSDYTNGTVKKYPIVGGYVLSGTLPAGLSFDNAAGTFSGTPTNAFSSTTYTVYAYNASGSGSTTVTLSCPATSAPTISYSPNTVNVYTTGTAAAPLAITPLIPSTLTGAPTVTISPTLPTGLSINSSTGTISGNLAGNTSPATSYTVTATNSFGSVITKISIACVIDDYYIGNGGGGGDWNNTKSWSTGAVPAGPTVLASIGVIAYKGAEPTVSANTTAYYVTFGSTHTNTTLTVNGGATFTINNTLTINKNASITLNGAGSINLATTSDLRVKNTGTLAISSVTVTLLSDATGSATVDRISTGGSITGTVKVQRFITGGSGYRGYRLLSSPVYSSTISSNNVYSVNYIKNSCFVKGTTGTAGGFDASGNPTLFLFRENLAPSSTSFTTGNYRGISNVNTAPTYSIDNDAGTYNIPTGNGFLFFFRGDRNASGQTVTTESQTGYVPDNTILTASGTLNQGAITVHDWYTPSSSNLGYSTTSGSASIQGFNLVGNPYASSIDWDTYNTTTSTSGVYAPNVGPFMYILDPVSQNYSVYQSGHGGAGTIATSQANVIPSGHGFFVVASNTSAQLVFNENAKINTQATTAIGNLFLGKTTAAAVPQYLNLKLLKDSVSGDGITINFDNNVKPNYDINKDALYKLGNGTVSLSCISADNVPLAISTQPLPKQSQLTINLNVLAAADGSYRLKRASLKGIPDIYDVWLMDAFKKDSLNLKLNSTYNFDMSAANPASYGAKRFSLVIRQNPALAVQLLNFSATKAAGGAQVVWATKNEQNYTNFTVERSTNSGAFEAINSTLSGSLGTYSFLDKTSNTRATYMYRLKLEDLNGVITYSKVIIVMYGDLSDKITNKISAYPNPASNIINLLIDGKEKPVNTSLALSSNFAPLAANENLSYTIKIVSITGTTVKTGTSKTAEWHDNVSNLAPGTYVIQVINNKDNSLTGKTTFIKL